MLYVCKLGLIAWCLHFVRNISITLQITDDFLNVIMHCDAISCVIYISNKVYYPEKEEAREIVPKKLQRHSIIVASKLRKNRETCCTSEWPHC